MMVDRTDTHKDTHAYKSTHLQHSVKKEGSDWPEGCKGIIVEPTIHFYCCDQGTVGSWVAFLVMVVEEWW